MIYFVFEWILRVARRKVVKVKKAIYFEQNLSLIFLLHGPNAFVIDFSFFNNFFVYKKNISNEKILYKKVIKI